MFAFLDSGSKFCGIGKSTTPVTTLQMEVRALFRFERAESSGAGFERSQVKQEESEYE